MDNMVVARITEDGREIRRLVFPGDPDIVVGKHGVTKIGAYDECGQGAHVPWLAVWKGDHLDSRINAAYVEQVVYG